MSESDFDTLHSRRGAGQDVIRSGGNRAGAGGSGSSPQPSQVTFHCSVKTISRSAGRSATAAIAYRAGEEIADERTGEIHDYTRKQGVVHSEILAPDQAPEWAQDRSKLWNAAEKTETRKNSVVAREWEVAIPYGLSQEQAVDLVREYAREIVERHGIAVDFAIHQDNTKAWDGSEKGAAGLHAHILGSTRRLERDGFTEKSRELDDKTSRAELGGLSRGAMEVMHWRERWAIVANRSLERAGLDGRIDHRSLKAQGIDRDPTAHLGPAATALERRGVETELGRANRGLVSEIHIEQAPEAPQERPQTYREQLEQRRQQERERSNQKQPQLAPDAKGSTFRERLEQRRERDKAQGKDNDRGR
jgi:hypothetical protein